MLVSKILMDATSLIYNLALRIGRNEELSIGAFRDVKKQFLGRKDYSLIRE